MILPFSDEVIIDSLVEIVKVVQKMVINENLKLMMKIKKGISYF